MTSTLQPRTKRHGLVVTTDQITRVAQADTEETY